MLSEKLVLVKINITIIKKLQVRNQEFIRAGEFSSN